MDKHTVQRFVIIGAIVITTAIIFSIIIYPRTAHGSLKPAVRSVPENVSVSGNMPAPDTTTVPQSNHGYIQRTYTNAQGDTLVYYLYIPTNYTPDKKYPLVLLLHGGEEKSNPKNTPAQNSNVILKQAYVQVWTSAYSAPDNPEIQQHWPAFIVVPQITTAQVWVNTPVHQGSYVQAPQPTLVLSMTMQLLNTLQHEYTGIDASRRYITGISSGAYGVWDAIERWPDYFAAAAPLSGAGDPSKAAAIKNLPIWAFHGAQDATVPVSGSRDMINALKAIGGNPRYTEFADGPHDIWNRVYSCPGTSEHVSNFFPWLFSQKR